MRLRWVSAVGIMVLLCLSGCAGQGRERAEENGAGDGDLVGSTLKIFKDLSVGLNTEILNAQVESLGQNQFRLLFLADEELDLLLFCDDLPLDNCRQGRGRFYTTRDPIQKGSKWVFSSTQPLTLRKDDQGRWSFVAVGLRGRELASELFFEIGFK